MLSCLAPRYRLLDVVFALWGTVAFLGDLGIDVWSAVTYYRAGRTVLALLHFGLYVLSSFVLQLLSCGWFWVDWETWLGEVAAAGKQKSGNGHTEQRSAGPCDNGCHRGREAADGGCGLDAAVCVEEKLLPEDNTAAGNLLQANGASQGDTNTPIPQHPQQLNATHRAHTEEAENTNFINGFCTSKIWLWPSCLTILHLLQLGYPLRCLHSLEVGIAAYKRSESSHYQEYAYFLTHDISMMRLIETFLENTPQLILVLYIIIQQETIHLFQYFSIAISFICISWAILDYHQSLRLFLKDKEKLNFFSSFIYFLWNFFLISARILCITLFTVTFHWMIVLHFVGLWLVFFLWACLQKTDFMKRKLLEPFYRATVAAILYFSWFNIADGRTIHRCIFYHTFITIDSLLLLLSWKYLKFPSILDHYESLFFWLAVLLTALGLIIRMFYYKYVHPNVVKETKKVSDETDGMVEGKFRMFVATAKKPYKIQNERMAHLAHQIY
ncbi:XK-related protein 8 [Pyxicephalus adspersus]|uniref:XK-related protein 8 n=1 Tax=Pyxicephalus adspersus TaxID=30357 RepID=UPI003B5AB419